MSSLALEFFNLNCSDARSACESPKDLSALFGQPIVGSCKPDTGICMCPAGYSGDDDWAHWNDCHINDMRRFEILLATAVCDCIALTVCFASLIRLGHRYGFSAICMPLNSDEIMDQMRLQSSVTSPPADTSLSNRKSIAKVATGLLSSITSGSLDQTNRTPAFIAIAKDRRRKSQSFLLLLLFLVYSGLSVLYHIMLLVGYKRQDNHWYFDLVLSAGATFLLWSLWIFMYLWYNSLPSLRYYGKLFNLNGFLVRHPNFVGYAFIVHAIAAAVSTLVLVVILPALFPELRSSFDTMLLAFLLVYVVDYITALVIVCTMLLKCFNQSNIYVSPKFGHQSSNESVVSEPYSKHHEVADNQEEMKRDPFAKARFTVHIIRTISVAFGIASIGIFTFMTWIPAGRKNLYVFFNVISWLVGIVTVVCAWTLVFRTSRGPKQYNQNRNDQIVPKANGETLINKIAHDAR